MINKSAEGLRSQYIEITNFKNIKSRIVDIGGKSFIIMGPNGAGKSSLIQAMMIGMDSKMIPSEPITAGEERAMVRHKISGLVNGIAQEYILDLYFTPGNKKGRLELYNEKMEKLPTPATTVKSIIGNVSFDVTHWLNLAPAKKLQFIKEVSGASKEIDVINNKIKDSKEQLKRVKDKSEDLEGALKNHEFTKEEIDMYSESKDVSAISAELDSVSEKQKQYDDILNKTNNFERDSKQCNQNIEKLNNEINDLKMRIAQKEGEIHTQMELKSKNDENASRGREYLSKKERPDATEIVKRMNEAVAWNEKHSRVKMLSDQHREMLKLKESIEEHKRVIDKLEGERLEILRNSQLPVEGLSFNDESLFIDGLPLEEGQINTQRLWEISVDIAIALNPNYKVIFIQDGSLLDREHLKAIVKKIEDHGYMAVIEAVDFDGGEMSIKFIEEDL